MAPQLTGYGRFLRTSLSIHVTIFVLVNLLLVGIWAASGGGDFWPIWSLLGWGIGVGCHAAPVIAGVGRRHGVSSTAPATVAEIAGSVGSDRSSLRRAAAPDGTVTLLFSDIEGSTVLNDRLGDLRWLELLRRHHAIVREQVETHGGFEVKAQGDGFMIAFPSARRAVDCARGVQAQIGARLADDAGSPIRVRIGLHTGEAIREESDFYGKNVVVAARIAAQARGGETLVSAVVKELTDSAGDLRFSEARELELGGLAGTRRVHAVE